MSMPKLIVALTMFLLLQIAPVHAAEPGNNFKFVCMPELNYMEITTVYHEFALNWDIRDKYGFTYPKDMECQIYGKRVTVQVTEMSWRSVTDTGPARPREWDDYHDSNKMLTLVVDGEPVIDVEDFGSYQLEHEGDIVEFPQLLVFDGRSAKVCGGSMVRECRIIPYGTKASL